MGKFKQWNDSMAQTALEGRVLLLLSINRSLQIEIIISNKLSHFESLHYESVLYCYVLSIAFNFGYLLPKSMSSSVLHCITNPLLGKNQLSHFSTLVKHCPEISGTFTDCLFFYFYSICLTLIFTFQRQTRIQQISNGLTCFNFFCLYCIKNQT